MATKIFIFLLFISSYSLSQTNKLLQKTNDINNDSLMIASKDSLLIEDSITNMIFHIPEVLELHKEIENSTNNKHGISMMITHRPTNEEQYYLIIAGYNSDLRFITYYNFYVYIPKVEIKILDVKNNNILNLKEWRKSPNYKQEHIR